MVDDLTGPLLEDNAATDGSFTSITDASSETCSSATSDLVSPLLPLGFELSFSPAAGLASPV